MKKNFGLNQSFVEFYAENIDIGIQFSEVHLAEDWLQIKFKHGGWKDVIIRERESYLEYHRHYTCTYGHWRGDSGYWRSLVIHERQVRCRLKKNFKLEDVMKLTFSQFDNLEFKIDPLKIADEVIEFTNHHNIFLRNSSTKKHILCTDLFDINDVFVAKWIDGKFSASSTQI